MNQIEQSDIDKYMADCTLCPRACHADRLGTNTGYCGMPAGIYAARAALHFWEEPCISGTAGSGAVFFSGCNMKCVFCQNREIASGTVGTIGIEISAERLSEIFLELQAKHANNINLVTGTHYIPQIAAALTRAKKAGLRIPVVFNSSGYEEVSSLKILEGLIDVYLPDLKYYSSELSSRYSNASDYFEKATAAIAEMFRQVGSPQFETVPQYIDGRVSAASQNIAVMMKKGVIVRHLILPGQVKDSKKILRYLHETYHNDIYVSIMNQYTPMPAVADIPELSRKVTDEEYARVLKFAGQIGIENGFYQEGGAADESFIPPFDYEGL
jgi:putative pyruvate formate lyase activating enzyme